MYETGLFNLANNIFQIKQLDLIVTSNFDPIIKDYAIQTLVKPAKDKSKIEMSFNAKFVVKFNESVTKDCYEVIFKYEFDQNKWNSITTP